MEGKRFLQWAGEFAAQDFQNMTRVELIKALDNLANLGGDATFSAALHRLVLNRSTQEDADKKLVDNARSTLAQYSKSIMEFFRLMYEVQGIPSIQLETDTYKVMSVGSDNRYHAADWNAHEITIKVWSMKKADNGDVSPELLEEITFPAPVLHLYNALDDSPADGFKKCPECERLFYHWSKRKKIYCSRRCKSRAIAKK